MFYIITNLVDLELQTGGKIDKLVVGVSDRRVFADCDDASGILLESAGNSARELDLAKLIHGL